jgi:hypothetical protein
MTISDQFADWIATLPGATLRHSRRSCDLLLSDYYWHDTDNGQRVYLTAKRKRESVLRLPLEEAKAWVLKRRAAEQAEIAADNARHAAEEARHAAELATAQALTDHKLISRWGGLYAVLPWIKNDDGDNLELSIRHAEGQLLVEVRIGDETGELPLIEALQILGRIAALKARNKKFDIAA